MPKHIWQQTFPCPVDIVQNPISVQKFTIHNRNALNLRPVPENDTETD